MGLSKAPEGYLVKASHQQVAYDMLMASRAVLAQMKLSTTKLFLGGWSQGGFVTMAFLEKLESAGVPLQRRRPRARPSMALPRSVDFSTSRGRTMPTGRRFCTSLPRSPSRTTMASPVSRALSSAMPIMTSPARSRKGTRRHLEATDRPASSHPGGLFRSAIFRRLGLWPAFARDHRLSLGHQEPRAQLLRGE